MRRRLYGFLTAAAACVLLLTGCSSYRPGTSENGVYRNEQAEFQFTTPENFIAYEEENYGKCSYYSVNKAQAAVRGTEKSWQCEYAANSLKLGGEVLICSEKNTEGITLQEYADKLGDQTEIGLLDLKKRSVEDVRLGGKIFKKVCVSTGEFDINVYIRQADDTFVYFYYVVIRHALSEGEEEAVLGCISAIA